MPRTVDLNARRAARAEALEGNPTVKVGRSTYELPAEMPIAVAESLAAGDFKTALVHLMGEVEAGEFMTEHRPSVQDVEDLLEVYGAPLPKQ